MKTSKKLSKKTHANRSVIKGYVKASFVVLMTTLTILNSLLIYSVWKSQQLQYDGVVGAMVIDAVDNINSPAIIDPISGKVYMPPSNFVLPHDDNTAGKIVYLYTKAQEGFGDELRIADKRLMSESKGRIRSAVTVEEALDAVPGLQACARGIRVTQEPLSEEVAATTKILQNGQKIYFYTDELCSKTDLLSYVLKIESL